VTRETGLTREVAGTAFYAARWTDYLATPARIHIDLWSRPFFRSTALFPGVIGLALAAVAVASGIAFTDRRARMCLAAGALCVYLSFGANAPGYSLIYAAVPLLRAIREVSRFGYVAIFATAALAGFGTLVLSRRLPRRVWPPVALALILGACFEPLAAPLGLTYFDGIPAIYARVPRTPGTVVAEFPFWSGPAAFHHAPYMLNSTRNWNPLVNGYSGFQPASFYEHVRLFASFPDAASLAALRRAGVTHVFVDTKEYASGSLRPFEQQAGVRKVDEEGTIALYAIRE
jgi:hypothetical protein